MGVMRADQTDGNLYRSRSRGWGTDVASQDWNGRMMWERRWMEDEEHTLRMTQEVVYLRQVKTEWIGVRVQLCMNETGREVLWGWCL